MTVRMTRHLRRGIGVVALAAFAVAMPAAAAPPANDDKTQGKGTRDDLRLPFQVKFDDARRAAIADKVRGKARGKTQKAKGRWVQLSREGTDRVFVVITEFGNARHSNP